mgnify:CR=1 FL=1
MSECKHCHTHEHNHDHEEENIKGEILKLVIALIIFVIAIIKTFPEKITIYLYI